MRTVFLVLVALNVALFAWTQVLAPPDAASDPRPLARQIDPAKLKIVAPEAPAAAPAPGNPEAAACIEWGSFPLAAAPRAEQALEPLALGARLSSRRGEETARWWVFIPPKDGRAGAQKAVGELKSQGVEDYFIMQEEGRMRWAVSLGLFSTEAAARARLEAVRAKGVRSAQTAPRETQVTKLSFQVQGADAALRARLAEIAQLFPGSELRDCPAPG